MRQYFAARSAPEDIADRHRRRPEAPRAPPSTAASGCAWASAAPRGPRPAGSCRCSAAPGDLTRDDIGAIRIFDDETLVQIHADAEARFFNALGDTGQLEREITVERSAPPPADARSGPRAAPRSGPRSGPRADSRPARPGPKPERPQDGTPAPGSPPRRRTEPSRAGLTTAATRALGPISRATTPHARRTRATERPRRDDGDRPRAARAPPPRTLPPAPLPLALGRACPDRPPYKAREGGKPPRDKSGDRDRSRPPRDDGKGADRPRTGGAKYAAKGKPGPGGKPARSAPPAAPARPERNAALDPSARLTRPYSIPGST
jgi:ATP-dependent RNA helicase DeaD